MPSDRGFETDAFASALTQRPATKERRCERKETFADLRLNRARCVAQPIQACESTSRQLSLGRSKRMIRLVAEAAARFRQTMHSDQTRHLLVTEMLEQRSCRAVATIRRTPFGRAHWSPWSVRRVLVAEIDLQATRDSGISCCKDSFVRKPKILVSKIGPVSLGSPRAAEGDVAHKGTSVYRRKQGSKGGIDLPVRLFLTCSNS